jgi:hypothetical protein
MLLFIVWISNCGRCLKCLRGAELEENLADLEERTETIGQLSHQLGVLSQDNKTLKQRVAQVNQVYFFGDRCVIEYVHVLTEHRLRRTEKKQPNRR